LPGSREHQRTIAEVLAPRSGPEPLEPILARLSTHLQELSDAFGPARYNETSVCLGEIKKQRADAFTAITEPGGT
jgi:hypothetical protein